MQKGIFGQKILELYRSGDDETLNGLLERALREYRNHILPEIEELMRDIDGKLRLKIMEALIADGGMDLIPFFIDRIRNERNVLFAKSMLLLFGGFEQQEALLALLELEKDLHPDLKSTYQRLIARYRAKYRESFYMEEFDTANPRRMKNAALMMVKEPHPAYLPFLHQRIKSESPVFQIESARILAELGDGQSLDLVLELAENSLKAKQKAAVFRAYLGKLRTEKLESKGILTRLAQAMHSSYLDLQNLWDEAVKNKKRDDFLLAVSEGFCFHNALVKEESASFWRKMMIGGASPADFTRMENTLDPYESHLEHAMNEAFLAIGRIARRVHSENLLPRLRAVLPPTHPNYERMMLVLLEGITTNEALELIGQFLEQTKERKTLETCISLLEHFEQAPLIPRLCALAVRPEESELRRRVQRLLGKWGHAEQLLRPLIETHHPECLEDAVQLTGQFKLREGYHILLQLVDQNPSNELLISIFHALRPFPSENTLNFVSPYLVSTKSAAVRQAALSLLFLAGGTKRLEKILQLIQTNSGILGREFLEVLLRLMTETTITEFEADFHRLREFWVTLLNSDREEWRDKILAVLEKCEWKGELSLMNEWSQSLTKIQAAPEVLRGVLERKRIEAVLEQLQQRSEVRQRTSKAHRQLDEVLLSYALEDHVSKVKAMRKLGMIFKPEMLEQNESGHKQLIEMLDHFLDANDGAPELILVALGLIAKLADPHFRPRLEQYLRQENPLIVQAARKALLGEGARASTALTSIFVMDDSKYVTKQLATVLANAGYQVLAENHAQEGLAILGKGGYDLLILDLEMPEMSGQEFLRLARQQAIAPKHTLVITATRNRDDLQGVLALGISGLLLKPFPMADMLEKIKAIELT